MSSPAPSAEPTELELTVEGMTCAACARRVEKALGRVEGVESVAVDLVRERALVRGRNVPTATLAVAAEQAGYRVRARQPATPPERPRTTWSRTAAALTLAAVANALPATLPPSGPRALAELGAGLVVTLGLGSGLLRQAAREFRGRAPGMSTLVAAGALASLALHAWALLAGVGSHHTHAALHSEAGSAALIVAFVLLGRGLEAHARARVRAALDRLDVHPTDALRVVRHGLEGELRADELRPGDIVVVPPHGLVPADGTVEETTAWLDEGHLTGEARPIERGPGEPVFAGAVNAARALRMRVTASGEATRVAQIRSLVRRAAAERSPMVEAAERWSARVVPAVMLIALGTLITLLASGEEPLEAIRRAVVVLVVACPCALGLATPTAIAAALGTGLRAGILIARPSAFERLADVRTFAFDKTGTLTEGRARPGRIVVDADGVDDRELLRLAAALETESEHPLGRAIFEEAMRRGIVLPHAAAPELVEGGVRGDVEGSSIEVGALGPAEDDEAVRAARAAGASIVAVRRDGHRLGWIACEDPLREEARSVVQALRARGAEVWMLSGDHALAAAARGREAGFEPALVLGGLGPEAKRERIRALEAQGPVAVVGDGINDAPALATASVGIAIGRGARLALESAGLTLEHGLTRLVPAIDLARRTKRVVRQNLALAFAYNIVAIPLAALGALDRVAAPWLDGGGLAALAMASSSVFVVASSLRLLRPLAVPEVVSLR
jgi:Cu+-exporting ATPase